MKNKKYIFIVFYIIASLILNVIIIFNYFNKYEPEDVNKDGKINALDLAIVQKKMIENNEEEK